jgi:hypothetical protein
MSQVAINPLTGASHGATASIRIFRDLVSSVNSGTNDPMGLSTVKPCRQTAVSPQILRLQPSATPRTQLGPLTVPPSRLVASGSDW